MDSHLLGQAVQFHGPELIRHLQIEGQRIPETVIDNLPKYRQRSYDDHDDENFKQKLKRFVAKKSDLLFTPVDNEYEDTKTETSQTDEEDKFAKMPPLESFMGVAPDYCRQHFYNSLEKRDLVVGVVTSVMESGLLITLLCMDGGKVRDIDELKITAFCPMKELPRLFPNQSPIEGFQVKDKVRGVVLNVNQETEKIIISLLDRSVREEHSNIKLGLINEDDFPVHYRRKLHIRGLTFDELLHSVLGFNNSGNVSALLELLQLSNSTSLMRGLHGKKIPEKEYAENLRKYQSQRWAHQSVANGVAMFKAGKQIEAMQYLNKALQIDSKNVEALVARGALYANNESFTRAIEDFEEALECNIQHQNARKYLYETLLAYAKVSEDQGDFDMAEKQYRKAMELQPNAVEVRELMRFMFVRKEKAKREKEYRGHSLSPVMKKKRSPEHRQSGSHEHMETTKTLKKLIREDKSRNREKKQYRGDERESPDYRSQSKYQRSPGSSSSGSSSTSSGSSSSGSTSSSSSDSEESEDTREKKPAYSLSDQDGRRRSNEYEKEAKKYRNPESSREAYEAELERRSASKVDHDSPSKAFGIDHGSSFLFGADGNYRTSPPPEEKRRETFKDTKISSRGEKQLSRDKSETHSKDRTKRESRKSKHEQEGRPMEGKGMERERSPRSVSSDHSSSKRRKNKDSSSETIGNENRLDRSFDRESGHSGDKERDSTKYVKIERKQKSTEKSEHSKDFHDRGEDEDRSVLRSKYSSLSKDSQEKYDKNKRNLGSAQDIRSEEKEGLDLKGNKKEVLGGKRNEQSKDSSATSVLSNRERERSLSPGESKERFLQQKYENWKREAIKEKIAMQKTQKKNWKSGKNFQQKERHDYQKKYVPLSPRGVNDTSKRERSADGRTAFDKGSGDKPKSLYDSDVPHIVGEEKFSIELAVKSKWDSPEGHMYGEGNEKRRRSRFDILPGDNRKDLRHAEDQRLNKRNEKQNATNEAFDDIGHEREKMKQPSHSRERTEGHTASSRELEGLRIHIRNDHFSDPLGEEEARVLDNTKGHMRRESPSGSNSSSRAHSGSHRQNELSPEHSRERSRLTDVSSDRQRRKRSFSGSESSDSSYSDGYNKKSKKYPPGKDTYSRQYSQKSTGFNSGDNQPSGGSDRSKASQKHNLPDIIQSAQGDSPSDRLSSSKDSMNSHRSDRNKDREGVRGGGKQKYVDMKKGGSGSRGHGTYNKGKDSRESRKRHHKDYHQGRKRSRSRSFSRSSSHSYSSSSSSSSGSPDRKKSHTSSTKNSDYHRRRSSYSNRSPHSYIDPYASRFKPKLTRAKFPIVKQAQVAQPNKTVQNVKASQPPPPPADQDEKIKKEKVLNELENFLCHLKEKKKEQTVEEIKK